MKILESGVSSTGQSALLPCPRTRLGIFSRRNSVKPCNGLLTSMELSVDPDVIERTVALSGGHPHLLQLLGSHLIEHEDSDPDGVIDAHDLANSLGRICYEDRARVYDTAS